MPLCGSLKNVCHLYLSMYLLLFYATIFFVSQLSDSTKDGLEKEMIDLKSFQKTPLKVVLLEDEIVLPSSDRSVRHRDLNYKYLCPLSTKNLLNPNENLDAKGRRESIQGWTIKKSFCLTKINFELEKICKKDFTFSITQEVEEQEKFAKFTDVVVDIFTFGYDVCPDLDYNNKTVGSYQLEIYKVYADFNTKQTLHTEHRILNEKHIPTPDFRTYMKELHLTQYARTLKRLPNVYMKLVPKPPKSKNTLRSFFSQIFSKHKKQKKPEDYLIPQMLVPYSHLEPSSARGANLNYLNIRPQYERLGHVWDSMSENIRYYLFWYQLYRHATIYTSASNILKQNNEEVKIKIDNEGKQFQINVPYVWWYLIITDDGKAIIFLLYNVPLDFRYNKMIFLCETTCVDNGWNKIQSHRVDENIYAHCCEVSEELLRRLGFIKSDDVQIKGILNLDDLRKELDAKMRQNELTKNRDAETSTANKQTSISDIKTSTANTETSVSDGETSVSDGETSAVIERISVSGAEASAANKETSVSDAETSLENTETSVSDKGKSIDFISSGPLFLLRTEITETDITFSSTSFSSYSLTGLPSTESIVQGCLENISGNDCIHVVPVVSTDIAGETCTAKVRPNIVPSETPCADEGILYTFQYNVCYNTNVEDDEVKFVKMPMVYSVCYDKKEKETIYTIHKVSAYGLIRIDLDKKNYIERLETYGTDEDVQHDLENMAITYKTYAEGYKFNDENVVPQMLVPLIDLDHSYAKGANFHFLNVRPQYERLAFRWDAINSKILQHLLENKLSKDVTIYTGTALNLFRSSPVIPDLQLDEKFSVRMPMIWAKIITLNEKSITILMYNIPVKHSLSSEQCLCSKSICRERNWLDIEPIQEKGVFDLKNTHVIQCCDTSPRILKHFRLSHIGEKLDGRFRRLILPEKLVRPKMSSANKELPKKSIRPETSSANESEITPVE